MFQVDLFAARGEMPRNLAEADEREKDIRFSSRTRLNTDASSCAARRRCRRPSGWSPSCRRACATIPDAKALAALPAEAAVSVVHLIYRSKHYESQSKDYEFSRASMLEHWQTGLADTRRRCTTRGNGCGLPPSWRRCAPSTSPATSIDATTRQAANPL